MVHTWDTKGGNSALTTGLTPPGTRSAGCGSAAASRPPQLRLIKESMAVCQAALDEAPLASKTVHSVWHFPVIFVATIGPHPFASVWWFLHQHKWRNKPHRMVYWMLQSHDALQRYTVRSIPSRLGKNFTHIHCMRECVPDTTEASEFDNWT